jgi:hypothetical protein
VQHSVICLGSRVLQTGSDVIEFQIGEILKDLRLAGPARKHFEYVLHPDTHPSDAGTSSALLRVKGNTVKETHGVTLRLFRSPQQAEHIAGALIRRCPPSARARYRAQVINRSSWACVSVAFTGMTRTLRP